MIRNNEILTILDNNKDFLMDGEYLFSKDYLQVYNINANYLRTFSLSRIGVIKKVRLFVKKISMPKKIFISSSKKKYMGNLLLIPSNRYGVKIFGDNTILTKYNDKKELKKILNNRKIISHSYDTPVINEIGENFYIEEKIISNNKKIISFPLLIYKMIDNMRFYGIKKCNICESSNRIFRIYFKNIDKEILSYVTYQHGDFWLGNIITKDDKLYLIDYEEVKEMFFLFDFFYFIYSECYVNKNFSYVDSYYSGDYNNYLCEMFDYCGIHFDEKNLNKYFMSFVYLFFVKKFEKCGIINSIIEIIKFNILNKKIGGKSE